MNDDDDEDVDEQNDDVDLIGYKEDVADPFEHLESKEGNEDNSGPLKMEYLTPSGRPATPILRKIEVVLPEKTELAQDFVDASYWR